MNKDTDIATQLKNDFARLPNLNDSQKSEFWQMFKKNKHLLSKREQEKIACAFSASDEDYRHLLSVVNEVLQDETIDSLANAQQTLDALSESERKQKSIEILKKL